MTAYDRKQTLSRSDFSFLAEIIKSLWNTPYAGPLEYVLCRLNIRTAEALNWPISNFCKGLI